ncbi:MAG: 8-amino-7-oxononanoate synthase [Oscillatoriophycideae cyanobacterium NC_groundwater_1537_Pr4_S-0.65um_50_18]|nr:8-amino-7-oxononanoate synthase [Oscillatoriophycideae cyanobacterium NC_groundwater_1537_Pr4_S-0.65um_50_18]
MPPDKLAFVDRALAERQQTQRWRSLQSITPLDAVQVLKNGRKLLNFSSNDYLGLSKHPALIAAAQDYTARYGTGSTASRLVTGTYDIHQQLEEKLAIACGRQAALLFNSGFQANVSLLASLLDARSLVLCDRLVHNSLIQGILASQARFMRYAHNDLAHLEKLLHQAKDYSRVVIVTETVFSMDGDRSDVSALVDLAQTHNAILYLDDAHALGVLGEVGMGLAAHQTGADVVVGTFGKAFGAFGAFVTCSHKLKDYFVNCCGGFIYTTALPPAVIGAIAAALELMPTLELERQHLTQSAAYLRTQLNLLGYDTAGSNSQIVPLLVGDEAKTLRLCQGLEESGILAIAIRPPTVAPGTSRIRLALSSQHQQADLDRLVDAIQRHE